MDTSKQKEKQKTQTQKRLSQFQWFEIQTKVRQTVYDLMQPFQKRQIQQFSKLHQMRKNIAQHSTTIKQHSFLLGSQQQSPTPPYIRTLETKISLIQSSVTNLQLSNKQSLNNFEMRLKFFQERSDKFDEIMNSFEQIRREKISDKEQLIELLNKQIQSLTNTVTNHEIETATIVSNIKSRQFQVDQQILEMQNKFRHYQSVIRSSNSSMEALKREFKSMSDKQFEDHKYIQEVDIRLNVLETDKELSKKFMSVVDEINNKMKFITNYIDRYLPLFVQAQLSDTLNCFITDRQRRALCVYQQKAFQNFNRVIIGNSDNDGLAENILRYVNVVEQIILRNRKYTIRLKVERKAKLGMGNSREYDIHKLDDSYEEEKGGVPVDTIVSEDKVKGIVVNEWKELADNIMLMLQKHTQDTKLQQEEFEGVYEKKYMRLVGQIEQVEKLVGKLEINNELSKKHLENENTKIEMSIEELRKQWVQQRIISRDLINFCSILNHVVIQDELDRQGIALFGLKETTKGMREKNDSTLGLDSKCLGCSGYPASTLSAFKMACLAYNPSSITVDGNVYRREEILDISTRLLENTKMRFEGNLEQTNVSINVGSGNNGYNSNKGQDGGKLSARNQKEKIFISEKLGAEKNVTLNAFNTLEIESKQVLPSIKSKRSNHTSVRKRSIHQSFYNPSNTNLQHD